ncbi:MAG: MBL fold metallo-hydrolase [Ardenticatenaceae bacterium]|nr:MBL fold metallo-hydrolase [Ardenticatenaceae bacterium]MCB8992287.1 MBL fold metallo-hydrolase [Ardenticatenaceae bacterium]
MIKILQLPLGPLQTNCYLLGCEETMEAAIIDPGWNGRSIAATADEQGWFITHILLTHSHFDHVGGLAELKAEVNAPIYIHPEAVEMLQMATMSAAFYQLTIPSPPPPDIMLTDGEVLRVGNLELHVLYTPGHAPGHVSFYLPEQGVLFDGDVLFQQGIGRTDLPGGDHKLLMQTILQKLMTLPNETHVLSGHGPATTIGNERQWNPFLQ